MASLEPRPFLTDPSGHEHHFANPVLTLGRAVENDVVIIKKSVSREHARIQRQGRHWVVEDLGSTNGAYVNGERIVVLQGAAVDGRPAGGRPCDGGD